MSVLDRKLFAPVRMHAGGSPPHAPAGHKHDLGDPNLSDEQYTSKLAQEILFGINEQEDSNTFSGIMEGFGEATDEKGVIDPRILAETIYPTRSDEDLRAEAEKLYSTDLSAERAEVERQKQEDVASSLIGFGARLMTGRGNALDIVGQAAEETLPEFMTARRATRKDVITLKGQEKEAKKAIQSYVMTKQQEDKIARGELMWDATKENLGFLQEFSKAKAINDWDMEKTIVPVTNLSTGLGTEVKLIDYLNDMNLPQSQRKYMKEVDYEKPFVMYDGNWGSNRVFTNYEAFSQMNKANPKRFKDALKDQDNVKDMVNGQFTNPQTGEYGWSVIRELDTGDYEMHKVDENGDPVLNANGTNVWIPIGAGIKDLNVGDPLTVTPADISPKSLSDQLGTILMYDRNIRSLNKIISNLADKPTRAGIVGLVKEMWQKGEGMMSDLMDAQAREDIYQGAIRDLNESGAETPEDEAAIKALFDPTNKSYDEFWGDFDPALAENRTRAHAIAYAVARARKTTGRLNLDDVKSARESLHITAFKDARTAMEELYTIRDELSNANNDMKMLYEHNKGKYPENYTGIKPPIDVGDLPTPIYEEKPPGSGNFVITGHVFPWDK